MNPPPPANGRKLWRVPKKPLTTSNPEHNTSQECLKNSLKIVAAGKAYSTKRPPLRRPKNQPGKPKDFVFVDLSPVRSDEEENKKQKVSASTSAVTVTAQCFPANISPLSEASNDSFSVSSDEESMFSLYDSANNNSNNNVNTHNTQNFNEYIAETTNMPMFTMPEVGLGLSMDDFQFDMTTFNSNFNVYPYPQQQQEQVPHATLKRAETTPYLNSTMTFGTPERKRAFSTSFEYKTPSPKKTQRASISETPKNQGLEAFMMFNDQIASPLKVIPEVTHTTIPRSVAVAADAYEMNINNVGQQYSPITDDSEVEDFQVTKLGKPIEFSNFDASLLQKQANFDLNAFVAF